MINSHCLVSQSRIHTTQIVVFSLLKVDPVNGLSCLVRISNHRFQLFGLIAAICTPITTTLTITITSLVLWCIHLISRLDLIFKVGFKVFRALVYKINTFHFTCLITTAIYFHSKTTLKFYSNSILILG